MAVVVGRGGDDIIVMASEFEGAGTVSRVEAGGRQEVVSRTLRRTANTYELSIYSCRRSSR